MDGGFLSSVKKPSSNSDQVIHKVSIAQALSISSLPNEEYLLDNRPVDKMMITARITQLTQKKQKIEFMLDDNTGIIEVGYFMTDQQTVADLLEQIHFQPNCYVSAVIFIKMFKNKVQFLCNNLYSVSLDTVISHSLQVIIQHTHRINNTGFRQANDIKAKQSSSISLEQTIIDTMAMDKSEIQKVYEIVNRLVKDEQYETGITVNQLYTLIQKHMNRHEYNQTVQDAEDAGYISVTSDIIKPV